MTVVYRVYYNSKNKFKSMKYAKGLLNLVYERARAKLLAFHGILRCSR